MERRGGSKSGVWGGWGLAIGWVGAGMRAGRAGACFWAAHRRQAASGQVCGYRFSALLERPPTRDIEATCHHSASSLVFASSLTSRHLFGYT